MENKNRSNKLSVILADDHPLIRKALKDVLENDAGEFKVIAEAVNGLEAVEMAGKMAPDLIIMDISMPEKNGIDATKEIHSRFPGIIIIVLTIYSDSEHILEILEAGASGYLNKKVFGQEIINAIRTVISGEFVFPQEIAQQIIKHAGISRASTADALNSREKEILVLAASGLSNKEIASKLNLSALTIKNYFAQIYFKLGVNSRTEAVIYSLRNRMIDFDDI